MPAFNVPANLAFDDFPGLVNAINEWLDRNDLSGSAQGMIALAESRMDRELAPHFNEVSASVSTVDGVAALPSDCGTVSRVIYDGKALPQLSVSGGTRVYSGARPTAYTLEGGQIRLWPSGKYTVTLLYQPRLVPLSKAAPTNTLLDRHPDLYFFGAMMFANGYIDDDARAATFAGLWEGALDSARQYFTRQRFSGPLVPRVAWLP